jgi:hypothetical protein
MEPIIKMKHIKLFEKFKEFDKELLKQDINGILIELRDKGFNITISTFKTMGRDTIGIVLMPLNQGGTVLTGFIIDDIDSYILTLVDYMKYKLGSDIYIEYLYWDREYGGFKTLDFSDKNKKTDAMKINFCEERVTGNSKW